MSLDQVKQSQRSSGALMKVYNNHNNYRSLLNHHNSRVTQHTHRSGLQFYFSSLWCDEAQQASDGDRRHLRQMTDNCSILITRQRTPRWADAQLALEFKPGEHHHHHHHHGFCSVKFSPRYWPSNLHTDPKRVRNVNIVTVNRYYGVLLRHSCTSTARIF